MKLSTASIIAILALVWVPAAMVISFVVGSVG